MTDIIIHCAVALLLPPLLLGVIGKTKAAFAGRVGAPYFQPYYDLIKLFRKGSVFSETTTWVFRAGPVVTLSAMLIAVLLIPLGRHAAPVSFSGDLVLFAYLFGLSRFFTTIAALDTGSSLEGMGAAREVTFSCLAEPTLFFTLITLARISKSLTLTTILTHPTPALWFASGASMLLLVGALFITLLAENSRIPFDDPNTHLELTMIHEVMVLDHSGPALGIILYGAALKLFVLGAVFVNVALPIASGNALVDWAIFIVAMLALAVGIGIVESVMARLRMVRIPQLLVGATILSAFAMMLVLR
jgi:formate hydrogenlyase subunit 4